MDSVLITGCSAGGLGSAMAIEFQKQGLHVFATGRNLTKLEHLSKIPSITLLQLDVTSAESVQAAVASVKKNPTGNGKLKYLINNAGSGHTSPILDLNPEEGSAERQMWETNYWGVIRVTKAFAPFLVQERGTVVIVGSGAGVVNFPWSGLYGSSKAAINLLSETLRLEVKPLGVKVITVVAGIIDTAFHANLYQKYSLPDGSLYKGMEGTIEESARGDHGKGIQTPAEFARQAVKDTLGGKTGNVYIGTQAWMAWVLVPFLPMWFKSILYTRMGGLQNFKKA